MADRPERIEELIAASNRELLRRREAEDVITAQAHALAALEPFVNEVTLGVYQAAADHLAIYSRATGYTLPPRPAAPVPA